MEEKKVKWYDKIIEYLIFSLVIIIPTVFHPAFYNVFSTPKLLALRLIVALIVFIWGLKIFVERKIKIRKSWINWILLFYGVISLLNTVFSSSFYTSIYGDYGRFLGIITIINLLIIPIVLFNFLNDKEKVKKLLLTSVAVSCVLSFYGILQYFDIWQEQFNWNQLPSEKVFGTIGHGNHFGAYLAMNFVLGVFLIKGLKSKFSKFLLVFGDLFILTTLILTFSRGALIALILTMVYLGVFVYLSQKKSKILISFVVLLLVFVGGVYFFRDSVINFPVIKKNIELVEGFKEGKIPDRFSWWLSSAEMIKDKPFLGYGLSTFRDIYSSYRRLDYETIEHGDQQYHITPESAHNEFLNVGATQGLIGLLAWLSIFLFVMDKLNGALQNRREDWYILCGVKGGIIVYLVQSFFSFGVISTLTVLFVFLGSALVLSNNEKEEEEVVVEKAGRVVKAGKAVALAKEGKAVVSGKAGKAVALAKAGKAVVSGKAGKAVALAKAFFKYSVSFLLLISGVFLGFCGVNTAIADLYHKTALVHSANFEPDKAMESFESAIALMPKQYIHWQSLGDFAVNLSNEEFINPDYKEELLKKAENSYKEAIKINPNHPNLFFNLGVAQIELYKLTDEDSYYKDALNSFDDSAIKALNNPLYPYKIAQIFMGFFDSESNYYSILFLQDAIDIKEDYRDAKTLLEEVLNR